MGCKVFFLIVVVVKQDQVGCKEMPNCLGCIVKVIVVTQLQRLQTDEQSHGNSVHTATDSAGSVAWLAGPISRVTFADELRTSS